MQGRLRNLARDAQEKCDYRTDILMEEQTPDKVIYMRRISLQATQIAYPFEKKFRTWMNAIMEYVISLPSGHSFLIFV